VGNKKGRKSLTLDVHVQPRSSVDKIVGVIDGRLKIKVSAPPREGASNARLVEIVARALGVSKSMVAIVKGRRSRRKTLAIAGIEAGALRELLARYDSPSE